MHTYPRHRDAWTVLRMVEKTMHYGDILYFPYIRFRVVKQTAILSTKESLIISYQ